MYMINLVGIVKDKIENLIYNVLYAKLYIFLSGAWPVGIQCLLADYFSLYEWRVGE